MTYRNKRLTDLAREHDEVTLPDGEVILKRKSTADMSVRAFAEYMERVTAYAATELGVVFHDV
jgi:hypothetical protein